MTEVESEFYLRALEIVIKSSPIVIICITLCVVTYFAWRSYQLARSSSKLFQHHTDNSDKITSATLEISQQLESFQKQMIQAVGSNSKRIDEHDEILKSHDARLTRHTEQINEHTAQIVDFKKRGLN